ncbi:MAG: single-stranded DNA-binding protein [Bacteroidales bacterium]|nr:single-stranded DNA-binding protein [Bacteroidales bacterium]
MNKLTIIGNLTRDPELRATASGISVCSFTVAVNRRRRQGEEEQTDFFRVTAWRQLGDNCAKWLIKGRKVCVVGPVSVSTYTGQDGKNYANIEVTAEDVEFLGGNEAHGAPQAAQQQAQQTQMPIAGAPAGFTAVETDDLPF